MALIFTPVFTDTFQRPNENPLNPVKYTAMGPGGGLQSAAIQSHFCVDPAPDDGAVFGANFYSGVPALTPNQYVEITIAFGTTNGANLLLGNRDDGSGNFGYAFNMEAPFDGSPVPFYSLSTADHNTPIGNQDLTFPVSNGDTFRLWCIGQTIGVDQNGVNLTFGTDPTYVSGVAEFGIVPNSIVPADMQVSKLVFGNVTGTVPGAGENSGLSFDLDFSTRLSGVRC